MPATRLKGLAFALVALGWTTSGYLLLRWLMIGAGAAGADLCSALLGRGCDDTLLSPSALQLGVPLAGWGLVYFALVGLLLALGTPWMIRAATLLTAGGVGAGLVMSWSLLSGAVALCALCLFTHAANLALLVVLSRLAERPADPGRRKLRAAAIGVLLGVGIAFQLVASRSGQPDRARLVAAYEALEPVELPPAAEGAAAPIRLTVFSSFQCPACRSFAVVARHLERRFTGDVALDYRHFPLESECNPALALDLHPRSCEAALAAEAARLQGAFWPYHDGLYDSDLSAGEDLLAALAIGSGLDVERWATDRYSSVVARRVRADAELGIALAIDATPTVFLNGRRLDHPSPAELEILIRHLGVG